MLNFEYQGDAGLVEEFAGLTEALQEKALTYMIGQAVNPAMRDIRANAPVKTGKVKKSLGRKKLNKRERRYNRIANGLAAVGIGATRKVLDDYVINGNRLRVKRSQAFKLRFIEEGTKAHRLYKGKKAAIKARFESVYINGRWFKKSAVMHSGSKANPFMTRTYKQHEPRIPERTMVALKKWMEKNAPRHFAN